MSSATAKWFDLSDYGSKLERKECDDFGHYKLMLEVPAERADAVVAASDNTVPSLALLDLGWDSEAPVDGRIRLVNYAALNRKSEIVAALRPFFTEAEIEQSHVPVHSLNQGEVVEGLQARHLITQHELSRDIDGVEAADFDRISASVKRAQELQAERHKKQTHVLFDGAGRLTFNHLTDEIMRQKNIGEAEAAFLTKRVMEGAARQPQSVHSVRLTDLARALVEGREEVAAAGVTHVLSRIAVTDDDWSDALDDVQLDPFYRQAIESMQHTEYGPLVGIRDAMLRDRSGLTPFLMDAIPVPVPVEQAFDIYKERIPFLVVRDSSVPSKMLAQSMVAVDAALDVVAGELEVPRHALIPRQKDVPLRFSFDAVSMDRNVRGMVKAIASDGSNDSVDKEDARDAVMMNLSVSQGGTFIHELAHIIDNGNSLTDQERHDILAKSGMLDLARQAVDKEFPQGGEYAEYLLREDEIFARSFDAHFVNVMRDQGDVTLAGIGGFHTTHGIDRAAPFGDRDKSDAFIAALKDTLSLRREARHEARQKSTIDNVAEASAPASFQI